MANKIKLSNGLKNFFEAEIKNENFGGISPATYDSAMDSWEQAPVEELMSWTNTKSEKSLNKIEKEMEMLIKTKKVSRWDKLEKILRG